MNHQKLIKYVNIKEGMFFCLISCHLAILLGHIITTFWLRNDYSQDVITQINMLILVVVIAVLSTYTSVAMRIAKHYIDFIVNNKETFHLSTYRYPKPLMSKAAATTITYLLPVAWIIVTYLPYELYGKINTFVVFGNLVTAGLGYLTLKVSTTIVHTTLASLPEPDSLDRLED